MIPALSVFSSLHEKEEIKDLNDRFKKLFKEEKINIRLIEKTEEGVNPCIFLILTGGTENQVIKLVKDISEPVLLIAHREQNSFPASLEILARLKQMNKKGKIILMNGKEKGNQDLKNAVKIIETRKKLKDTRIGIIGEPSEWLVASSSDTNLLSNTWGPEIIKIPVNILLEKVKEINDKDAISISEEFVKKSKKVIEPHMEEIKKAGKIYLAVRKIIRDYNLNSLTIQCFELIGALKTTGCYALSRLNDEGIISGCEGDLHSTLTMVWLYYLTKEIPFMANPQDIDIDENSLWIAHCTIPIKLLRSYIIRSHFESSLGVGIQGEIKRGKITFARIGGEKLNKLYVTDGKIIQCGNSETRCRTQIKIKINESLDYYLKNPLGNHHILIKGHWSDLLKDYYDFYFHI